MEKGSGNSGILLLVPILFVILAFMANNYLIAPLREQKQVLEDQKSVLQTRKAELQNLKKREEEFKTTIKTASVQINEALDKFAPGQRPEKSILFADGIEKTLGPTFSSLGFSEKELVTNMNLPLVNEAEDGTYSVTYSDIELYRENLTISYSAAYEQMKAVTDFISGFDEKMNLKSISASFDETKGTIAGNIIVNLYSVVGGEKVYEDPEIEDIRIGVENIFTE